MGRWGERSGGQDEEECGGGSEKMGEVGAVVRRSRDGSSSDRARWMMLTGVELLLGRMR